MANSSYFTSPAHMHNRTIRDKNLVKDRRGNLFYHNYYPQDYWHFAFRTLAKIHHLDWILKHSGAKFPFISLLKDLSLCNFTHCVQMFTFADWNHGSQKKPQFLESAEFQWFRGQVLKPLPIKKCKWSILLHAKANTN